MPGFELGHGSFANDCRSYRRFTCGAEASSEKLFNQRHRCKVHERMMIQPPTKFASKFGSFLEAAAERSTRIGQIDGSGEIVSSILWLDGLPSQ